MIRALAATALLVAACKQAPPPPPPPPDLAQAAVPKPPPPPPPPFPRSDLPRIDVHVHVEPGALSRAVAFLGKEGIVHLVNLSGGGAGAGLEETLAEAKTVGHTTIFANPAFREARMGPGYGARIAAKLKAAHALGARGVKISKGLGLGYTDDKDRLLPIDDKGLDPLFDEAGRLGMPIAIHSGDPKAFWLPPTPQNERWDELKVHPGWSFFGHPMSWEELYAQFERRVARHKKTRFIGVHFGNAPEEPERVARMLDKYPNLFIDTAARIPEIGRVDANHDAQRMRAFFARYQDRILFGTDAGIGVDPADLMLGSTGDEPPDVRRFFDGTWRWFETDDKQIPTPTPIQGRWDVDGIGLPREILEKVYYKNAVRLLGIKLPTPSP